MRLNGKYTKDLKTIGTIVTIDKLKKFKMDITTIQLNKETKNKISSFGMKGDSYDDILKRIYSLAVKEQLREFLLSSENTISIEEARREAEKLWPRSK